MSKILIIERHRMLRHAIVFVLCPNHEVKIATSIPPSADLGEIDAVIVDGASLGDTDGSKAQAMGAVEGWNVPTVWVEGGADVQVPRQAKLISIKAPIEKRALLSALAECLGNPPPANRSARVAAMAGEPSPDVRPANPSVVPGERVDSKGEERGVPVFAQGLPMSTGQSETNEPETGTVSTAEGADVIDLVDVVDEASPLKQDR